MTLRPLPLEDYANTRSAGCPRFSTARGCIASAVIHEPDVLILD